MEKKYQQLDLYSEDTMQKLKLKPNLSDKLSKEMLRCLKLFEVYDQLIWYPGGYWAREGIQFRRGDDFPKCETFVTKKTLKALERRQLIHQNRFSMGQYGVFVCGYKLKKT